MVMPRDAGIIILIIKVPMDVRVKLAPCMTRKVALKTIRLAGIGTIICSIMQPKNTAQDALVIMNDSVKFSIEDNILFLLC